MALTAENFLYPTGEITSQMFPDVKASGSDTLADALEDLIQGWVMEAATKTTSDEAGAHWVYYRAYSTVATRLASTPSQESFHSGQVVRAWGKQNIEYFQNLANYHRDAYDELVGNESFLDTKPAKFRVF